MQTLRRDEEGLLMRFKFEETASPDGMELCVLEHGDSAWYDCGRERLFAALSRAGSPLFPANRRADYALYR